MNYGNISLEIATMVIADREASHDERFRPGAAQRVAGQIAPTLPHLDFFGRPGSTRDAIVEQLTAERL